MSKKGAAIIASVVVCMLLCFSATGGAADIRQVPLWDGETSAAPDGLLINRYGGPVVYKGGTKITVSHVADVVHAGHGAYRADIAGPVLDYAFFQLALSGSRPSDANVMSRDLTPFKGLSFWLRNNTGVAFTLKLKLKDYRDSNANLQYRRLSIPAGNTWRQYSVPLNTTTGWTIVGAPDLTQARFIGFVFEALPGKPLNKSIYFDDVVLAEKGAPMDPMVTDLRPLVMDMAKRQFLGLWGSRNSANGLVPLNSVYADVGALNTTAAVVKLLPAACMKGWVSQSAADAYVTKLIGTLNVLMNSAVYLPPRYVDWVALKPAYVKEESPVDAAFLALALYQYRSLSSTSGTLRAKIDALLARFHFGAFGSPQGWKLAYKYDTGKFTSGAYDGYSGEIWTISLAAHLINHVDILTYYHTGVNRVRDHCADPNQSSIVHTDKRFRAPFLQWLFPLFVKLDTFPADNYPKAWLATNPLRNARRYQRDAHIFLQNNDRGLFVQPDAGDDGSGANYNQYSCYEDFDSPQLFMPWAVAFSLLVPNDYDVALNALRSYLENGLHGPLGLSDSVHWETGAGAPASITARHDFWNVALSTMAMFGYLFQDNAYLTNIPAVHAALEEVYP